MAIKFEKIQPGMTLWDVRKNTGFSRFRSKWSTWPVRVIEVDAEKRRAFVSWNTNQPKWMYEHSLTKLRAKKLEVS